MAYVYSTVPVRPRIRPLIRPRLPSRPRPRPVKLPLPRPRKPGLLKVSFQIYKHVVSLIEEDDDSFNHSCMAVIMHVSSIHRVVNLL